MTEKQYVEMAMLLRQIVDSLEHESCGVDSFSLEDRAREYMSEFNMEEGGEFTIDDPTARDLIFTAEFVLSCIRVWDEGSTFEAEMADIKQRFFREES